MPHRRFLGKGEADGSRFSVVTGNWMGSGASGQGGGLRMFRCPQQGPGCGGSHRGSPGKK